MSEYSRTGRGGIEAQQSERGFAEVVVVNSEAMVPAEHYMYVHGIDMTRAVATGVVRVRGERRTRPPDREQA